MESEERKVSKFSSGLNIIMRLDTLWRNIQEFKRKGQYSKWNDELDTIWLELARDIPISDYEDRVENGKSIPGYKKQFEEYDKKLEKQAPFNDYWSNFKKPDTNVLKRRDEQYKILMEKQLFLARLENVLDKGTTYEEEDDDF